MDIKTIKTKYEQQLLNLPNVTGVAIGKKEAREVIKVFVKAKMPEATLRAEDIIPKSLEGYEIDVEEIGHVSAQSG